MARKSHCAEENSATSTNGRKMSPIGFKHSNGSNVSRSNSKLRTYPGGEIFEKTIRERKMSFRHAEPSIIDDLSKSSYKIDLPVIEICDKDESPPFPTSCTVGELLIALEEGVTEDEILCSFLKGQSCGSSREDESLSADDTYSQLFDNSVGSSKIVLPAAEGTLEISTASQQCPHDDDDGYITILRDSNDENDSGETYNISIPVQKTNRSPVLESSFTVDEHLIPNKNLVVVFDANEEGVESMKTVLLDYMVAEDGLSRKKIDEAPITRVIYEDPFPEPDVLTTLMTGFNNLKLEQICPSSQQLQPSCNELSLTVNQKKEAVFDFLSNNGQCSCCTRVDNVCRLHNKLADELKVQISYANNNCDNEPVIDNRNLPVPMLTNSESTADRKLTGNSKMAEEDGKFDSELSLCVSWSSVEMSENGGTDDEAPELVISGKSDQGVAETCGTLRVVESETTVGECCVASGCTDRQQSMDCDTTARDVDKGDDALFQSPSDRPDATLGGNGDSFNSSGSANVGFSQIKFAVSAECASTAKVLGDVSPNKGLKDNGTSSLSGNFVTATCSPNKMDIMDRDSPLEGSRSAEGSAGRTDGLDCGKNQEEHIVKRKLLDCVEAAESLEGTSACLFLDDMACDAPEKTSNVQGSAPVAVSWNCDNLLLDDSHSFVGSTARTNGLACDPAGKSQEEPSAAESLEGTSACLPPGNAVPVAEIPTRTDDMACSAAEKTVKLRECAPVGISLNCDNILLDDSHSFVGSTARTNGLTCDPAGKSQEEPSAAESLEGTGAGSSVGNTVSLTGIPTRTHEMACVAAEKIVNMRECAQVGITLEGNCAPLLLDNNRSTVGSTAAIDGSALAPAGKSQEELSEADKTVNVQDCVRAADSLEEDRSCLSQFNSVSAAGVPKITDDMACDAAEITANMQDCPQVSINLNCDNLLLEDFRLAVGITENTDGLACGPAGKSQEEHNTEIVANVEGCAPTEDSLMSDTAESTQNHCSPSEVGALSREIIVNTVAGLRQQVFSNANEMVNDSNQSSVGSKFFEPENSTTANNENDSSSRTASADLENEFIEDYSYEITRDVVEEDPLMLTNDELTQCNLANDFVIEVANDLSPNKDKSAADIDFLFIEEDLRTGKLTLSRSSELEDTPEGMKLKIRGVSPVEVPDHDYTRRGRKRPSPELEKSNQHSNIQYTVEFDEDEFVELQVDTVEIEGAEISTVDQDLEENQPQVDLTLEVPPPRTDNSNSFECPLCSKKFTSEFHYKNHQKDCGDSQNVKRSRATYLCSHCGFTTTDDSEFKGHIDQHKVQYSCSFCPFKTSSESVWQVHKKTHRQPNSMPGNPIQDDSIACFRFACRYCPFKCTSSRSLSDHMSVHFDGALRDFPPQCPQCPYMPASPIDYITHGCVGHQASTEVEGINEAVENNGSISQYQSEGIAAEEHPAEQAVVPSSDIVDLTDDKSDADEDLLQEMQLPSELLNSGKIPKFNQKTQVPVKPKFPPPVAASSQPSTSARRSSELMKTNQNRRGQRKIIPTAQNRMQIPKSLQLPQTEEEQPSSTAKHTKRLNANDVQCPVCHITFETFSALGRHIVHGHSKKKPKAVRCVHCVKTFTSQDTLNRHMMRFHVVECLICSQSILANHINHHMINVHNSECFKCSCNFVTTVDPVMRLHKMVKHKLMPAGFNWFCPVCPGDSFKLNSHNHLVDHVKRVHRVLNCNI